MRLLPGEYIQGLRRLDKAYRSQLQQLVGEYELTPGEMAVLLFLHNNAPELDTASDIVRCRDLSKALVARSVESLRQKGYVTLSRDEHDRRVIHLDRDLHGDPVFFCLFRVEGEDRVDGIIFTVGADLLRLEHLLIVAQIILQGSEIPTVGTIPDDSQVLPEIMPCPAVILNSGGEKIVLVRLDL